MAATVSLETLGWRNFFASQIDASREAALRPGRVLGVYRGLLSTAGPEASGMLRAPRVADAEAGVTVGDWVLVEPTAMRIVRILDRQGLFKRGAAGADRRVQLIVANVDTLLIVTSANRDFNIARLERYLTLARESSATPVIVVTKADLNNDAHEMAAQAERLAIGVVAVSLDAHARRRSANCISRS